MSIKSKIFNENSISSKVFGIKSWKFNQMIFIYYKSTYIFLEFFCTLTFFLNKPLQNAISLHISFFWILHSIVLFWYHIRFRKNKNIFYWSYHEFYRSFIAAWPPYWVSYLKFIKSDTKFVISDLENIHKVFFFLHHFSLYLVVAILDPPSWIWLV